MKSVILFGSPLNPLSAIVAKYLHSRRELKCVILPDHLPPILKQGIIYGFSMAIVGAWRYLNVWLRFIGLKDGDNYLSLKEFLCAHSDVSTHKAGQLRSLIDALVQEISKGQGHNETLIVSCIYPLKIPIGSFRVHRMINIHPGLLPENRGPNPYFWCLTKKHSESGITYHVLTDKMDQGPILYNANFCIPARISENGLEALSVKVLKESLPVFWERLDELWKEKRAQSGGCYYSEPTLEDRRKYGRLSVFSIT